MAHLHDARSIRNTPVRACADSPLRLLIVALVGCGDEPLKVVEDDTVRLNVRAYRYDHQAVQASAGELTFRVTNQGPAPTNFRVRRADKDKELVQILTMQPGETDDGRPSA